MVCAGCEITLTRYKSLYREGGKAENMYILLEGPSSTSDRRGHRGAAHAEDPGRRQRRQARAGVRHGDADRRGAVDDGDGDPNCKLLQFSAADLGLSRDKVKRGLCAASWRRCRSSTASRWRPSNVCCRWSTWRRSTSSGTTSSTLARCRRILVHGNVDVILNNGLCVAKLTAHAPGRTTRTHSSARWGCSPTSRRWPTYARRRRARCSPCRARPFSRFLNLVPDEERTRRSPRSASRRRVSAQKKSRAEMSTATFNQTAQKLLQQPRMVNASATRSCAPSCRPRRLARGQVCRGPEGRLAPALGEHGAPWSVTQIEKADEVLQKLGIKPTPD